MSNVAELHLLTQRVLDTVIKAKAADKENRNMTEGVTKP